MTLNLIPIFPEDNLFLRREGSTKGYKKREEQFARVFAEAWQRIPIESRAVMKTYFEEGQPLETSLSKGPSPYISVQMDWRQRQRRDVGVFFPNRGAFHFWEPFVTMLLRYQSDETTLQTLIAHELAHAYRNAAGLFFYGYNAKIKNEAYIGEELSTRALPTSWGFDERTLDLVLAIEDRRLYYHERKCAPLSANRRQGEKMEEEREQADRVRLAAFAALPSTQAQLLALSNFQV